MKKLLLLIISLTTLAGYSQCVDPLLTDFECNTPSHPLTGGVVVTNIPNPFSTGINTSANVGEAVDNGTEGFDALIVNYGAPIDLTTNPIFHIKVYTELTTPIPLVAKVEGGDTPLEIATTIDTANEWTEYTFDFSSVASSGNTTLVVFFNFGQNNGTTTDTYYIDDLFFGPPPTMCEDPLLTDFECDLPSHPITGGVPVTNIPNPFSTGINTSANVGEVIDNGTEPFDAIIVDYGTAIDLTTNPIFHTKIYTELPTATPIPIVAKVEGGTTPLEIQTTINTSNEWTEYTFDFSSVADSGHTRLVLFFRFNQNSGAAGDTYYIDDLFFGPPPTMCEDPILSDFECDLPSHPFTGGATVTNIPNPFPSGLNTSENVGRLIDDGTQPFDAMIVEYGAPIDLVTNPIFNIKVYTELTTPIPLVAKVEGGTTPLEISTTINTSNEWTEHTFDFSSVANTGNTRLVVFFRFNQTDGSANDVYYIDDLFFGTTPVRDFTYVDDTTGWTPNSPNDLNNPSTANDNIIVRQGTATLDDNIVVKSIVVDDGAVLNTQDIDVLSTLSSAGTTNIFGILNPNTAQINVSGNLVLKSTETATGIVADASQASFNGNVTVERHIPASNRAYRLLSTPVQNAGAISTNWQQDTHITGSGGSANGFDDTATNASSMFFVDEQALPANYVAVNSTTGTTLNHGEGYLTFIRGDRSIDLTDNDAFPTATTLSSTGTLFTGSYSLGASELNNGDFNAGGNGSSLIANPYQAPVNMEQVLNNSSQINSEFIHVYDPSLGDRGAFVTVGFGASADGSSDITNFTLGTNAGDDASPTEASRFLQPGSAVFVNTLNPGVDGTASPSLTFNENDKATDFVSSGPFRYTKEPGSKLLNMQLFETASFENNETPVDGVVVRFDEQYSNAVDTSDAYKVFNLDENLATTVDGKNFSIQSRSLPVSEEEIALSIDTFTSNSYTFKVSVSEFDNVSAYLLDSYLGTETLLENDSNTIVPFSLDTNESASVAADRFSIIFKDSALSIDDNKASSFAMYPNPVKAGRLFIQLGENSAQEVTISTLLGQQVMAQKLKENLPSQSIDVTGLSSGTYIVSIKTTNNNTSKLLIIQ